MGGNVLAPAHVARAPYAVRKGLSPVVCTPRVPLPRATSAGRRRRGPRARSPSNKPHGVPSDWISPVSNEANANGTMTNRAIKSIARQAARTICASWPVRPATARARKAAIEPSKPTEEVMCAVSANFRRLGVMIMVGDSIPPPEGSSLDPQAAIWRRTQSWSRQRRRRSSPPRTSPCRPA